MPKIPRIERQGKTQGINAPRMRANYTPADFATPLSMATNAAIKPMLKWGKMEAQARKEADAELSSTLTYADSQAAKNGSREYQNDKQAGANPTSANTYIEKYNEDADKRFRESANNYANEDAREKALVQLQRNKDSYKHAILGISDKKRKQYQATVNAGIISNAFESMVATKDDASAKPQYDAANDVRTAIENKWAGSDKDFIEDKYRMAMRDGTEQVLDAYIADQDYEKALDYAENGMYGFFADGTAQKSRIIRDLKNKRYIQHATEMADQQFGELDLEGDFSPENIQKHRDFTKFVMHESPTGYNEFVREFDSRVAQHFKAEHDKIKQDGANRLKSIENAGNKIAADRIANGANKSQRDGLLRRSEIKYGKGTHRPDLVLEGEDRDLAMGVARYDIMNNLGTVDEIAIETALSKDDIEELREFAAEAGDANTEGHKAKVVKMIDSYFRVRGMRKQMFAEKEKLYKNIMLKSMGEGKMPTAEDVNNEMALQTLNGTTINEQHLSGRDLTYNKMMREGTDLEKASWLPLLTDKEAEEMRNDPQYADIDFSPEGEKNPNDVESLVYRQKILGPLGISFEKQKAGEQNRDRAEVYRKSKDLKKKQIAREEMSQVIANYKQPPFVSKLLQERQPEETLRETTGVESMMDEALLFAPEGSSPIWMEKPLMELPLENDLPQHDMNGKRFENAHEQLIAARIGNNPENKVVDTASTIIKIARTLLEAADDIPD